MAYPSWESNARALDYFVQLPVSRDMVRYLANEASQVISCDSPQQLSYSSFPPTPPNTPPHYTVEQVLPPIEDFITSLVVNSRVQVPTLMSSLVYLHRLKAKLSPFAKGMQCTIHRILLASIILAAKNLNDSSPKNKHWAACTTTPGFPDFSFSATEVNMMERQMLFLLNWDLLVSSEELYHHLEPFLEPIRNYQAAQEVDFGHPCLEKRTPALEYYQQPQPRIDYSYTINHLSCGPYASQCIPHHVATALRRRHHNLLSMHEVNR
jgi:G1/S-specific cyclin PLC1